MPKTTKLDPGKATGILKRLEKLEKKAAPVS